MLENRRIRLMYMSVIHLVFICFGLMCIVPMIIMLSISLSSEHDLINSGFTIIPKSFDITAYTYIFKNSEDILRAYFISAVVTIAGSLISLLLVSTIAYPLSRADFKYRNKISFYVYFTMLFCGGLVPWYMLIEHYLHMKDTIWVLIVPLLVNPWYIFLLRTYFQKIPPALIEVAKIDGANELYIYYRIILPLSKPAIATVGLFTALMYWNDSYLALLFIFNDKLIPLQYMLYKIMINIEMLTSQMQNLPTSTNATEIPTESVRMAMGILAAGPMLFVFPFFQKYFVKGLTVGSVKG